jgi:dihydroorotate dehydrogenase (fumarate)
MPDLSTSYLGLNLRNPVIVSSSGLTDSIEKIKILEQHGAAAVVLKSLFEEQIRFEDEKLLSDSTYPEAHDYIRNYSRSNTLDNYLSFIEKAKKEIGIPIIASINCISSGEWIEFSRHIQEAGADALELNVFFFPSDKNFRSADYEQTYYDLALKVKSKVTIPVAFKLGQNFTSVVNVVDRLYFRGINGVVLFNKFYEPDIDINKLSFKSGAIFSTPSDISKPLRWVGIISKHVEHIDIAASTGVHNGKAVIKLLLAGAHAVMVCSVLYKNGPEYLKQILDELVEWMKARNYKSIKDFRGILNYGKIHDPRIYERSQFMKYFSNYI